MRSRERKLLTVVVAEGVPGPRCCVLFRWLEGRFVAGDRITPAMFEQVGGFMARLHLHAQEWNPPEGFTRYRVDWKTVSDLVPSAGGASAEQEPLTLGADRVIERVAEHAMAAMEALGEGRDMFSLVHADLVPGNYLFHKGDVRAIDFDDCCWSYFLYDMALALWDMEGRRDYRALRAAFLRGYRGVRPLQPEHEEYLDTFVATAHLLRMLWVSREAVLMAYKDWAPEFVARSLRQLEAFLESQRQGKATIRK